MNFLNVETSFERVLCPTKQRMIYHAWILTEPASQQSLFFRDQKVVQCFVFLDFHRAEVSNCIVQIKKQTKIMSKHGFAQTTHVGNVKNKRKDGDRKVQEVKSQYDAKAKNSKTLSSKALSVFPRGQRDLSKRLSSGNRPFIVSNGQEFQRIVCQRLKKRSN